MILNFLTTVFDHRLMEERKKEVKTAEAIWMIAFTTLVILSMIKHRVHPLELHLHFIAFLPCCFLTSVYVMREPYTITVAGLFSGCYAMLISEEYCEGYLLDVLFDDLDDLTFRSLMMLFL